jgi:16S rRNA (guanine966-N2)-methyltransferase
VSALRHAAVASLNLVFLDPPFDSNLYEAALASAARVLATGGFVFLESATLWTDAQLAPLGLVVHRHLKAGAVHAHLLRTA